jgi:integrase
MVVDELRQHRLRQERERGLAGAAWRDTNVVFASQLGTPLNPENISHRFQRVVAEAGVSKIALHGLRHTAATLLLQAGVHPRVVQEMLGHSSIDQTLGTYSHVMPTMHRDAANKIDALLKSRSRSRMTCTE